MPIVVGGALLAGGYFLFATEAGQELLASFTNPKQEERKKWENPFKYLTPETADAWDPKSKRYGDIQKRIYKKYQSINDYYDY